MNEMKPTRQEHDQNTTISCEDCNQIFRSGKRLQYHRRVKSCTRHYYRCVDQAICEICENLEQLHAFMRINIPFQELNWSADDGCKFCQLVLDGLKHCNLAGRDIHQIQWNTRGGRGYAKVEMRHTASGAQYEKNVLEFFRTRGRKSEKLYIHFSRLHSEDTSSTGAFNTALRWLQKCKKSHNSCGFGPETPLPTRVLDLLEEQGSTQADIRLVETTGEIGRYNCLSYCWGQGMTLKTTQETLDLHKARIPWQSLPKTFQDAIEFTRRLGVRYIWIDSLCIIQHDKEDWERESAKMYEVYRKSYLTLAATSSANAEGGCFSRDPLFRSHYLSLGDEIPGFGNLWVRRALAHRGFIFEIVSQGETIDIDEVRPLMSRGWAYQERLLSPRVLHFTNNELVWECMEAFSCECQPEFLDRKDGGEDFTKVSHRHCLPIELPFEQWPPKQVEWKTMRWHEVVAEYSQLGLTVPEDRLPGLAGLAKQMQTMTGDTYLAGLWRSTLLLDVLWYIETPPPSDNGFVLPGPSWSWASILAAVSYPRIDQASEIHFEAELLEAMCTSLGASATGVITSGRLCLRAKLIHSNVQVSNTDEENHLEAKHLFDFQPPINSGVPESSVGDEEQQSGGYHKYNYLLLARHQADYDLTFNGEKYGPEETTSFGLLLAPISQGPDVYRRVGFFEVSVPWESDLKDVKDQFSEVNDRIITIV